MEQTYLSVRWIPTFVARNFSWPSRQIVPSKKYVVNHTDSGVKILLVPGSGDNNMVPTRYLSASNIYLKKRLVCLKKVENKMCKQVCYMYTVYQNTMMMLRFSPFVRLAQETCLSLYMYLRPCRYSWFPVLTSQTYRTRNVCKTCMPPALPLT